MDPLKGDKDRSPLGTFKANGKTSINLFDSFKTTGMMNIWQCNLCFESNCCCPTKRFDGLTMRTMIEWVSDEWATMAVIPFGNWIPLEWLRELIEDGIEIDFWSASGWVSHLVRPSTNQSMVTRRLASLQSTTRIFYNLRRAIQVVEWRRNRMMV